MTPGGAGGGRSGDGAAQPGGATNDSGSASASGGVGGVGESGGNPSGAGGRAGGEAMASAGSAGTAGAGASEGCTLYAAPNGSGGECTAQSPCSLFGARDKVRTLNANMTADIEVCLEGGTYELDETFALSESDSVHDSGTNGFDVVYRARHAEQRPLLSGGRAITGFQLHDAGKNIWRAPTAGLSARQLFVNDVRAIRARSKTDYGMVKNDHGFTANTSELAGFKQKTRIELSGELDWRHYRCPVESIDGTNVRLQDPCWSLSQDIKSGWWNFKKVSWVENAYELLDDDGEFYFDEQAELLFYRPRQGEDMATARVIVPVLETLLHARGTLVKPLRNIVFRGIAFAHATWNGSNGSLGYTSRQSGFLHRKLGQYYDSGFYVMPSNLVFEVVENMRFEDNVVRNLGGSGLDIFRASRNNALIGNRFQDISGRAITLGHIDDVDAPDTEVIKGNVIRNNAVFDTGVEYRDCAIIFIGYTEDTLVEHNWLRNGPYTGISLGWGWDSHPDSSAGNNIIRWNRIEDFMRFTFDGSGVYALGVQRGSSVDHNYIYRGLPRGEGIFPDVGASYMFWEWNVIEDVGYQWIHDWSARAHHNTIRHNITNQPNFEHKGGDAKMDVFEDNIVISGDDWPAEALAIKARAGLEPEFAHVAE
jgi:hypothetical protein